MKVIKATAAGCVFLILSACGGGNAMAANGVQAPPSYLKLPTYYKKYIDASGIAIVSNEAVDDAALLKMQYIVNTMVSKDEPTRQQVVAHLSRIVIIPKADNLTSLPEYATLDQTNPLPGTTWDQRAQGVGWSEARPYMSCSEANLMHSGYPMDRYTDESICIHEFAHTVFDAGIVYRDPDAQKRLTALYNADVSRGLLGTTYAGTNTQEYWAEGVQAWFSAASCSNKANTPICTQYALYQTDPQLWNEIGHWFPAPYQLSIQLYP